MFRENDRKTVDKRKKLWKLFGWSRGRVNIKNENGVLIPTSEEKGAKGFFRNNHSLNCGCQHCKNHTWFKKFANRRNRRAIKQELHHIDDEKNFKEKPPNLW